MGQYKVGMPLSARFEEEKSELNALLASGLFSRAPSLENLLKYVCEKHFEGHPENVKEYNIAVEALGRPPDFDQKRDSIVRVEAYRLRRRLSEYYSGEGAGHNVHILIPQGQYAPKFVFRNPPAVSPVTEAPVGLAELAQSVTPSPAAPLPSTPEALDLALVPVPAPVAAPVSKRESPDRRWRVWAIVMGALVATTLSGYAVYSGRSRKIVAAPRIEIPVVAPQSGEVRILAGLTEDHYVDSLGRAWWGDRYFHGGSIFHGATPHRILGALDPMIYQGRRQGVFGYDIPLKPGIYELRLHFAETLFGYMNLAGGGETSRVFQVWLNGKPLLKDFDVIADAGSDAADVKIFKDISPAADGQLHLEFQETNNEPFLNAIEILPSIKGRAKPLYMMARDRGYTDKSGRYWEPDHYARGGVVVARLEEVAGAPDPELHRGERFGNLTYSIPVAAGRYGVTLRFAEAWFGPGKPAGGGVGSRLFDIFCNGVALVRNFDIFKEAGGADRLVTRTFHGLEPNHQGKLIFSLVPVTNYACINAIEVVDESK